MDLDKFKTSKTTSTSTAKPKNLDLESNDIQVAKEFFFTLKMTD